MRARPQLRLLAAAALAAFVAALPAREALAVGSADYTVTATSGLYESPPAAVPFITDILQYSMRLDLPFEFSYFGVIHDHVKVTTNGLVYFGNDAGAVPAAAANPSTVAAGASNDGACAPYWFALGPFQLWKVKAWTTGSVGNRRYIVSWENVNPNNMPFVLLTYQVKFFEGSNRIEFAYKADSSPTTWSGTAYSIGMVAPGADTRWVAPVNTLVSNTGHPANDYRFDPRNVTITGTALIDRPTPTANGLGSATTPLPMANLDVQALYPDGRRFAHATTDASGTFQLSATAGAPGLPVDIHGYSEGTACIVKTTTAAATATSKKIVTGIDVSADNPVGSIVVDAALDPSAAFRGAASIASAVQRARAWVGAHLLTVVPKLTIVHDPSSSAATAYKTSPVSMTISGAGAANNDAWDDPVVIRTYGRHVLAALAPPAAASPDDAFDKATTETNAFALAFGHFLAAAVTGERVFVDSTGVSTAVSFDLEEPQPVTPPGSNVAAWVATALYDLTDPANEPSDSEEGFFLGPNQVMRTVDALAATPSAATFHDMWMSLGFGAPGISRLFVADGLLADDGFEPNDFGAESRALGALGFRRDGLTLNVGNEDWFDVTLPEPAETIVVDVDFPRTASSHTVELELLTASGVRVADVVDAGTGPITVTAGPLAAGTYRLHVGLVRGKRVPAYTLQTSTPLVLDPAELPSWTVGFPYDRPLAVGGGLGALSLVVQSGSAPPGLVFDAAGQRVHGTPTEAGVFDFDLAVTDAGKPTHVQIVPHHVVISPALELEFAEILPLALGRAAQAAQSHTGGTAPVTLTVTTGALPEGISLAGADLRFTGTPTTPGSSAFSLHAADAVGSVDDGQTTAVVCVPVPAAKTPSDLAMGTSACGFFFDAVAGSTAKCVVTTAPKQPVRTLSATIVGADGRVVPGVVATQRDGKASASSSSLPASGRYFFVVSSDSGGATQLLGSISVAPGKRGRGSFPRLSLGETVTIEFGALAGASVSLKAVPDKKTGPTLAILDLVDPNGVSVPLDGLRSQKGSAALLSATLGVSGTWKVRVSATGAAAGTLSYSLKLKQPKGVTYSAD